MKLLRFGEAGNEKPGILDSEGNIRSLERVVYDLSGDVLTSSSLEKLKTVDPLKLPLVEGNPRIAACVGNVGKFLCIGLNYTNQEKEGE